MKPDYAKAATKLKDNKDVALAKVGGVGALAGWGLWRGGGFGTGFGWALGWLPAEAVAVLRCWAVLGLRGGRQAAGLRCWSAGACGARQPVSRA